MASLADDLPTMSREQLETTCRSLIAELAEVRHRASLQWGRLKLTVQELDRVGSA